MGPYYTHVVAELGIPKDATLAASLADKNAAQLIKLKETIEDAVANLGETEQSDALIAKANYLSQIGSKVRLQASLNNRTKQWLRLKKRLQRRDH